MKTFLHYTKERELDEGIMGKIGGILGSATRTASKVAKGAEWFKSNVAPAFQQGAKPGSTLSAAGNVASGITSAAEESREKDFRQAQRFVSAKRRSLGKNHPKVSSFDSQEADILDPKNTTYKSDEAREAALRKHYSDYKWN